MLLASREGACEGIGDRRTGSPVGEEERGHCAARPGISGDDALEHVRSGRDQILECAGGEHEPGAEKLVIGRREVRCQEGGELLSSGGAIDDRGAAVCAVGEEPL